MKTYGQLQSFFSAIQTIGSPIVGILLDRLGIRYASAIVFGASALSYLILAEARSMTLLFCSKIPTALQHAFLVAQAAATTSTAGNDAARAQALGRMTTAYTIGATIGPMLGGQLAEHGDLYMAARLAVVGSLISVVLSVCFLPGQTRDDNDDPNKRKPSLAEEFERSRRLAFRSTLWPLLTVKVVGGVAASMHATAMPLVLTEQLHFDPAELGFLMSCCMFGVAVFGAFGMGLGIRLFGAGGLSRFGLIGRVVVSIIIAGVVHASVAVKAPFQSQILVTSVLHELASHALATAVTTQTTGAVEKHEQGALLGLEHCLFSLARIVGPPMGTWLLASGPSGFWSVAITCASIDIALVALLISTGAAENDSSSDTVSKST